MSIYNFPVQQDTFVYNNNAAKPQCRSQYLPVGKISDSFFRNTYFISYIFFDLKGIEDKEVVTSAALRLNLFSPPFVGTPPEAVVIQMLAEPFRDCQTNFLNRPTIIPKMKKIVPIRVGCQKVELNITNFVKCWLYGGIINHGLALLPISNCSNGVLFFHGKNCHDKRKQPLLTVKTLSHDIPNTINKLNLEEVHPVAKQDSYSSAVEIWDYSTYSLIVKNIGKKNILVKLQCSPDNVNFIDEEPEIELCPGVSQVMVSNYFTRYVRLKFRLSSQETDKGLVKIWLQGRQ